MNDYIVMFKESKFKRFKFLKDFGHVLIFVKDINNNWIGIDCIENGIDITVVPNNILLDFCNKYNFIYLKDWDAHKNKQLFRLTYKSCVSTIKSILGINKYFIFTPKQLYNFLLFYRREH